MATQTRVPGATSSEVDFELERFERTAEDRIEISGRWFGLRGRRFVRPVLNLNAAGTRRRAIALLEHKPWAADDGKTWIAAFRWPEGAGAIESAELEVGPGLVVDLPALDGKGGTQTSVRLTSLRPDVAPHVREPEDAGAAPAERPAREDRGRDAAERAARRDRGRDVTERAARGDRDRDFAERADRADRRREPARQAAPPRDVVTAAIAEREEAVSARDASERDRLQALNDRDDALSRRDAALRDVDRAVSERQEAVAERDRVQSELDRVTRERDIAHAERNRTLQDFEAVQRERDQAAAERDAARAELARALPAREEAIRTRDAEAARADQAESDRDTAFAERKSAVAQRDRARRERDRAMRAAGVEPPHESPHVAPAPVRPARAAAPQPTAAVPPVGDDPPPAHRPESGLPEAAPPGTPLPSRPLKRIGQAPAGPASDPKRLLTPVDSGRPRRLSRTRRPPSASARWAVRLVVVLLMIAITLVLVMLLARTL
jgi:hypothetical protein